MTWLKFKHGTPKNQYNVTTILAPTNVLSPFSSFDKGNILSTNVEIAIEKPHSQGPNNCNNVKITYDFIKVNIKL
jgi:hypothetical protein